MIECDFVVVKENNVCKKPSRGNTIIEPTISTTINKTFGQESFSLKEEQKPTEKHVNSEESTNQRLASSNFSKNNTSSNEFIIKNQPLFVQNQMMAALGQPSTGPPNCGATQSTVDPR